MTTKREKAQVAAVSAHNDSSIGDMVADAIDRVGSEGAVTVEEAKGIETSLEVVGGDALATLVVNRIRGVLPCAAVEAPGYGDRRKAMLQDLAIVVGGRVISEELGIKLENVAMEDVGSARRVVMDKDKTTIIDGGGSRAAIEGRAQELRKQIAETTSDYDRRSCRSSWRISPVAWLSCAWARRRRPS